MKWNVSCAAAAAFLLGAASAGPVKLSRQTNMQTYRLRVSYEDLSPLDGSYLSINDASVGVFTTSKSAIPLEFYVIEGVSEGTWEIHTYPIGIVDHALGLVGMNGLLKFTDITNPAATSYTEGTTAIWTEWGLDKFPPIVIQDNGIACVPVESSEEVGVGKREVPRDQLVYYSGKGAGNEYAKWMAFPGDGEGDWNIFWNNGSAITTANSMPIEVVWEFTGIECA
ncbi:hypothetical protein MKZ38_007343 [Zalerion maritima]|uniref:Uncharacterized protein n=1 Tax=Zalerion maritima TaxID=339359 RepID=A0AAD5WU85_9PEZI|nr:hypothetical protein MKZ38_007343 [Zalerion maritima]